MSLKMLNSTELCFCFANSEKIKETNETIRNPSKNMQQNFGHKWFGVFFLAPVVQRPDNFIQWISHYPTVSICAKISVFPLVQANMNTLTTA